MNFAALIKSELRKLAYARSTWWLLVGSIAFASLSTVFVPLIVSSQPSAALTHPLNNPSLVDAIFAKATAGYFFAMIIGAMSLAGEFSRGTALATFLAAPKRINVLFAKIVTTVMAGAVFQIISTGVATGAGLIALQNYEHVAPSSSVYLDLAITAVISGIVLALVGLAVGALLRNQVATIVGLLVWMLLVDSILTAVSMAMQAEWGKFMFSSLIAGMMNLHLNGVRTLTNSSSITDVTFFDPLTSIALLVGYAVVLVAAALATSLRRDID